MGICEIPGQPEATVCTKVVKQCIDPVWGFETNFNHYVIGDSLVFTVYDNLRERKQGILGRAKLTNHRLSNGDINDDLPLEDVHDGISAFLRVQMIHCNKDADEVVDDDSASLHVLPPSTWQ